jgi:16S rRNA (cytidine1402-2'-O)-methyltransferase
VENLRTARRYLKQLWKEMPIDDCEWVEIGKKPDEDAGLFRKALAGNKNIAILSEAGCPGVADPGQLLVAAAQQAGVQVRPLVGPNSILLALMASGLNGQHFTFHGYLPIDHMARKKALQQLQAETLKEGTTHIFIETPYRNDAMVQTILEHVDASLKLCVAVDITAPSEYIATKNIGAWKKAGVPALHKRPCIFLIGRG